MERGRNNIEQAQSMWYDKKQESYKGRCGGALKEQAEKRKELLQKIKKFCLMDDSFMSRVFDENMECTELVFTRRAYAE